MERMFGEFLESINLKKWNNLNDLNIDQGSKLALINKGLKNERLQKLKMFLHFLIFCGFLNMRRCTARRRHGKFKTQFFPKNQTSTRG